MKITYWSDYACPWCYIGVSRLKNAIKELGVESLVTLKMRAYQLDPGAPLKAESDNITKAAARFGVSKEEAMAKMRQMFDMAKANGIEFNYATARNTNTFDAHRLTKLAESKGDEKLLNAMIDRLYKAYFTDNLELADHETLVALAKEAGLDETEVREMLAGDKYGDLVLGDERQSALFGVRGVPFFLAGMYNIPGCIDKDTWIKVLMEVLQASGELDTMSGMACGPDGCDF
ncbi:MAG: DsbA family oxidoreductase [Oscillospiraceae bacterium]|nr:DsbA family oxidoreductase [Oscillospiraceae bacterium]